MPTVNSSKTKVGEYLFYGTQYNGDNPVTNIAVSRTPTSPIIDSSFYHDWVRTPNYFRKVPVIMKWVPKANKPLRTPPKMPTLILKPIPKALPKDPKRSLKSYQRYLNKVGVKLRKVLKTNFEKEKRYKARFARYLIKLRLYEEQQSKIRNGVVSLRKVPTAMGRDNLQWNARERRMRVYSPLNGLYTTNYSNKRTNGEWVDTYQVIANNIEDFFPTALQVGVNATGAATAFGNAVSAATSYATAKLYDKLGDQSAHIANIVAERHQTFGMISEKVKQLANLVETLRRTKNRLLSKGGLLKGSKDLSDEFLQFVFGVQPLIADIHDLAEKAAHWNFYGAAKASDSIVVRAQGKGSDSARTSVVTLSNGKPYMVTTTEVHVEVTVRFVLEYSMANPAVAELQKLGLINPLEVAWEVMPWSFVVDWLLPIGNWISALTADAGLTYRRGVRSTTTTYRTKVTRQFVGVKGDNLTATSDSWKTGTAVASDWQRIETRVTLPSPPSVRFPSFKSPYSWKHLAESVALVVQRIKK